jgi:hypothetical protein
MKNQLLNQLCIAILITGVLTGGCKKQPVLQAPKIENDQLSARVDVLDEDYGNPRASMSYFNTFKSTDFFSAGVGLRSKGNGTINLPNTFLNSTVTQAFLYWAGVSTFPSGAGQQINVNSSKVTGVRIGYSNSEGYISSQAYRADITALLRATNGRAFSLSGFGNLSPNGASIVLFYSDGNSGNNRDVVLFDGNDSNIGFDSIGGVPEAVDDTYGWHAVLPNVKYTTLPANLQLHVSDGDPNQPDGGILIGPGLPILADDGNIFNGTSVPGGGRWDIKNFNLNPAIRQGENNLILGSRYNEDYLNLIVAVFDLPAGTAPPSDNIKVPLDLKPDQCPNTFICAEKGLFTVAIAGTSDIDVSSIDLPSLTINGIGPESSAIEDITSPTSKIPTDCNSCATGKPDGKKDLVLKFDIQKVGKSLGNVGLNQCVRINIIGTKRTPFGTRPINGVDFFTIKNSK